MSRDRSLDEFTAGPESESETERSEGGGDGPEDDTPGEMREPGEDDDPGEETRDVDPMGTTYGFSPEGAACESCGASVQGRWRDGERRVCADCKEW